MGDRHEVGVRVARVVLHCIISIAVLPITLAAQATVTVPLQDPVYRDLDRLFGNGVIKTMVVGQRPYSRREIARILIDISRGHGLVKTLSAGDQRLVDRLSRQFAPELRVLRGDTVTLPRLTIDRVRGEFVATNAAARAIPRDSTGAVDADVDPLLADRAGRVYRPGPNVALDADLSYRVARQLVLRADPRLMANADAGRTFSQGSLEALSATALVHDIAVEVGRQQFVWGQGMEGGLLGSTSSRPLDMIRITTDTPFHLPPLGPARGTFVLMDLGANQHFPHSTILAYKLSGNPFWSRFELSASVLAEQGGSGAPAASFVDHMVDWIPALKYTLNSQNRNQFSNKFAGWEYRLRLPELSGLQLYAEHQFDDMDPRRWKSTLWEDGGHIAGMSFAHLGKARDLSATAEFHHTGIRYYKHNPFISGIAFNRTLLGDPLGNQGDAGYLRVVWDAGGASALLFDAAVERRRGDVYIAMEDGVPPNETNFHFVKLQDRPDEFRHRATATWQYQAGMRWRTTVEAGYERASNFNFVQDASRNGFLVSAGVELLPW